MVRQVFGYTPVNPVGTVGFVQLHARGTVSNTTEYEIVVREHDQAVGDPQITAICPLTAEGLRELQHAISVELAKTAGSAAAEAHPAPVEFTEAELQADPILRYFHYSHLPPHLQERSRPFAAQAKQIIETTPRNAERTSGLRKLLECKDCIVRAALP